MKYKLGIPRVSNIISFIFPFEGNSKERYLKWLRENNIGEDEYLGKANEIGTFIHNQMEKYIKGEDLEVEHNLYELYINEITAGIKYIDQIKKEYKSRQFLPEFYVLDEKFRYQGTSDLILINEKLKEVMVWDWKSWGVAKSHFNLKNDYKKNYDKLKKVSGQLSFYGEVFRQKDYKLKAINCAVIHKSGLYNYSLPIWSSDDINKYLDDFSSNITTPLTNDFILEYNYNTMEVRINTNIQGKEYTNAEIILKGDDFEGLTMEEKIEKAIELQKYLVSKY